jgi:hypothetical protein
VDCLVHFNEETLKKYGGVRKLRSFNDGIWEIQHDPDLKSHDEVDLNDDNDASERVEGEEMEAEETGLIEEVVEGDAASDENDEQYEDLNESQNSDEIDIEKQSTDSGSSRTQKTKKTTKSSSKSSKKANKKSSKKVSKPIFFLKIIEVSYELSINK